MKAVGKFSTRPSLWQASREKGKRDSGFTACGYSADRAELAENRLSAGR
jgi:hypothetical protein